MRRDLTFLLIDDDIDDQEIFLTIIQNLFPLSKSFVAGNGRDGLNKLMSREVEPDIIFLDLNMPLMNGKQFLTEVKKNSSLENIPVIILSTSSDKNTITESKQLGAIDFITKPDRFSDWKNILEFKLSSELLVKSNI